MARKRTISTPSAASSLPVRPGLGLVCVTAGPEVRYRSLTRTHFLSLGRAQRQQKLADVYLQNLAMLFKAVDYCHANGIRLYRVLSQLFPQMDDPQGRETLEEMRSILSAFALHARAKQVRVIAHPDQYIVLNSESADVRRQSVAIMEDHALVFDLLGLEQSPWSCLILHGGRRGPGDELVELIGQLPAAVRNRLVLENDESAWSAAEILDVCRRAKVPMVFDAHHHLVHEELESYEDPSIRDFTLAARVTWPDPAWQVAHISNGAASLRDRKHSELITAFPPAFNDVPWVEIEAKGKETAIAALLASWA